MTMGSRGPLPGHASHASHSHHSPITAFSALHLLRSYNQLLTPTGSSLVAGYNPYGVTPPSISDVPHLDRDVRAGSSSLLPRFDMAPMLAPFQPYSPFPLPSMPAIPPTQVAPDQKTACRASTPTMSSRRPRGEKKPIPDEQKDDRYYERRKRNNQAAKKSRDARKLREDQIALRATILEHENAVLRAQNLTLREEAQSLRQLLLLQRKIAPEDNDRHVHDTTTGTTGTKDEKTL